MTFNLSILKFWSHQANDNSHVASWPKFGWNSIKHTQDMAKCSFFFYTNNCGKATPKAANTQTNKNTFHTNGQMFHLNLKFRVYVVMIVHKQFQTLVLVPIKQLSEINIDCIHIGDSSIASASQARNLGAIFDSSMTMKPHISNVIPLFQHFN